MLKLEGIPRLIVGVIVTSTTSVVVGNVIAATTPLDLSKIDKINIKVGGYVLGVTAGAIASKYTLEYIDETLAAIEMIRAAVKAKSN